MGPARFSHSQPLVHSATRCATLCSMHTLTLMVSISGDVVSTGVMVGSMSGFRQEGFTADLSPDSTVEARKVAQVIRHLSDLADEIRTEQS